MDGRGMKRNYGAELAEACERFRATMAAYEGSWEPNRPIVPKGQTLYIVRRSLERPEIQKGRK